MLSFRCSHLPHVFCLNFCWCGSRCVRGKRCSPVWEQVRVAGCQGPWWYMVIFFDSLYASILNIRDNVIFHMLGLTGPLKAFLQLENGTWFLGNFLIPWRLRNQRPKFTKPSTSFLGICKQLYCLLTSGRSVGHSQTGAWCLIQLASWSHRYIYI